MNITLLFIICAAILIFIILYRSNTVEQAYKFISVQGTINSIVYSKERKPQESFIKRLFK